MTQQGQMCILQAKSEIFCYSFADSGLAKDEDKIKATNHLETPSSNPQVQRLEK